MAIVVTRSVTSGEANLKAEMLDLFYPVGSYYETSDTSFNPNTAWGGTWAEDTAGRILVATDSSTFATVGGTGGAKTHSHNARGTLHADMWLEWDGTLNRLRMASSGSSFTGTRLTTSEGNTYTDATNASNDSILVEGTTATASSLQPYIVVKRWHRTA